MFLDYNEYIDEYMPNFGIASIEENPDLGSFATMLDGGMYALPRTLWTYNIAAPIYYRGDMLEELGAEAPTTVDEFYDLLVLAKEHYADVEGFYPFLSPAQLHPQQPFPGVWRCLSGALWRQWRWQGDL